MLRKYRNINVFGLCGDDVGEEGVHDWFLGDVPRANCAITRSGENEVVRGGAHCSDLHTIRDEMKGNTSDEWPERLLESLNCGGGAIARKCDR